MNDSELPHAVWEGTLQLFGATLRVFVLSDGRRIVDEESFGNLLDAMGRELMTPDALDVHRLARFVNGRGVPEKASLELSPVPDEPEMK